ncbi:MAG: hypothetical protein V7677_17635 [Motiliproteus sp.]
MKRRKLKLAKELRELLTDAAFSKFTMLEVRDAYESRYGLGECTSSSELRKWIYRRILPLIKKGYLAKTDHEGGQTALYQVTDKFKQDFLIRPQTNSPKSPAELITGAEDTSQVSALKSKRNQYQVDMLACAGECKEYQQLATDYPHLRDQIEPMFRSARERSSELMGQFRAINNLLKHTGLSE